MSLSDFYVRIGDNDEMPGTDACAFAAGGAESIINARQIVFHDDGTVGTGLGTDLAADTTGGADVAGNTAGGLGHAGDKGGRILGDELDDVLGTGVDTETAADAVIGIDNGNAILDGDSALGAGTYTGTEAEAAELTGEGAAGDACRGKTVLDADVVEFAFGMDASAAADYSAAGDGRCRQIFAGDLSDLLCGFFTTDTAEVDVCLAVGNRLGVLVAGTPAACTAVCTGKFGTYLIKGEVGNDSEAAAGNGEHSTEKQTEAAENGQRCDHTV